MIQRDYKVSMTGTDEDPAKEKNLIDNLNEAIEVDLVSDAEVVNEDK